MKWVGADHDDPFFPLPVSGRSQGPVKAPLYDMFVCRTDSSYFRAYFAGPKHILGFRNFSRPGRQKLSPVQECAARYGRSSAANCSGVSWVSTKISCLVCMSSSSGMKKVGVALFAPELRCKLENAPGDWTRKPIKSEQTPVTDT